MSIKDEVLKELRIDEGYVEDAIDLTLDKVREKIEKRIECYKKMADDTSTSSAVARDWYQRISAFRELLAELKSEKEKESDVA